MLTLTDRKKDLMCPGLTIGGILLMIFGLVMSAPLLFWIAFVVFLGALLIGLVRRSLTAVECFSTVALSLIAIIIAISTGGV
ncbi:hypothetical protein H8F21_14340 [Pseudomonas sp. P66]|uniref:Uncharacterized protein n=1 Tax=Pseudomonas arcuscaelestis TaxID=2710591 RepID=A0ABS2BYP8_9PSED|nr:hypothetical protein [Pseudomonas arcuscaelestis]MBM5458743.1 hypothetical protein [Pseudomonas arcuscaelestis]